MGSIKRQGISSGIFMYLGTIVGFVNSILLFPKILGESVFGFAQWFTEFSGFFLLISSFGSSALIIRFFPYFKDKAQQHGGFLSFLFIIRSLGLVIAIIPLLLFKPELLQMAGKEENQQFVNSFYYLIPIYLALMTYFELFESYSAALFRPRFPTLLRDVIGRLTTTVLIVLFYFDYLTVYSFLVLYVLRLSVNLLGIIWFVWKIGELHFKIDLSIFRKPFFKQFINYGFFSILSSVGSQIINKIDILMITAFLDFSYTGIYAVFYFISLMIVIPHQGIAKITSPIIADAWKQKDMAKLKDLYRRLALDNFVLGCLLFIGIVINLDNIIALMGDKYGPAIMAVVFLGLSRLFHLANGYTGEIIIYSPRYTFALTSKLITAILTVSTNYFFIQWYGIIGAAMATALTVLLANGITQLFVYYHFNMHPFSWNMVKTIGIGLVILGINSLIPLFEPFWLDLFIRSAIVTISYASLVLTFKVAPDISEYGLLALKKARQLIFPKQGND